MDDSWSIVIEEECVEVSGNHTISTREGLFDIMPTYIDAKSSLIKSSKVAIITIEPIPFFRWKSSSTNSVGYGKIRRDKTPTRTQPLFSKKKSESRSIYSQPVTAEEKSAKDTNWLFECKH